MEASGIDLIIINFNTKHLLADCLESIKKYTEPEVRYQIWVVDNGSTDGSVEYIASLSWVNGIYNQDNLGYGTACNLGIKQSAGKYIFLLNSDIKATPNWLMPLCKVWLSSHEAAVVGPRLVNPDGLLVGTGVIGTNAQPVIRGWGMPNRPELYNTYSECISIGGACMGIKRELLPVLGLFDEHYFHYFEETDYCYNARYHGYKIIYCPESTVIHRVNGSCNKPQLLNKYYRESQAYFQSKWRHFFKNKTVYR